MKKIIMRYYPFHDRTLWYSVSDDNKLKRISWKEAFYKIASSCISSSWVDDLTEEFILG